MAHARLGPLLVSTGEAKAAVPSLRIAARDLEAKGFADKAVSLHMQLAAIDPGDLWAWETASRLHVSRGRTADAVKVLALGASRQGGADGRAKAIKLLRDALALSGDDSELLLALARRLRQAGETVEARALIERALERTEGPARKRARWTAFVLFPGLGTLWRWLRA